MSDLAVVMVSVPDALDRVKPVPARSSREAHRWGGISHPSWDWVTASGIRVCPIARLVIPA